MSRTTWTDDEIKTLIRLRQAGLSVREIARQLPGRNHNMVIGKVFRLRRAGIIGEMARPATSDLFRLYDRPQARRAIACRGNQWARHRDRIAAFRAAWIDARACAGQSAPPEPRTLLSYVMSNGGVKPCQGYPVPLCATRSNGLELDEMASAAHQHHYLSEPSIDELVDGLNSVVYAEPDLQSVNDRNERSAHADRIDAAGDLPF